MHSFFTWLDLWSTYPTIGINWVSLSHFTNILEGQIEMKLLRMRRWAMYGEKDKCFILYKLSKSWSWTSLFYFPEPKVWKLAQLTPLSPTQACINVKTDNRIYGKLISNVANIVYLLKMGVCELLRQYQYQNCLFGIGDRL